MYYIYNFDKYYKTPCKQYEILLKAITTETTKVQQALHCNKELRSLCATW